MVRLRTALALAGCLLAVACSDDPTRTAGADSSPPGAAEPAEATPPRSPEPSATGSVPFPADTRRDEQAPEGGPLTVTAVRVARADGYDRVVFELAGRKPGEPGWRVEYVDNPRRDGSGEPVQVEGKATLVVLIDGAGYPFDTGQEQVRAVEVPADTEVVADVELGSVFEGVYEAFIGVTRKVPFRVFRLADPARVVVDLRHS